MDAQELREANRRRFQIYRSVSMNESSRLCRQYLRELVESSYKGELRFAGPAVRREEDAEIYFVRDGRLSGRRKVGKRLLIFPKYEEREVTPDEVPFERYPSESHLEEIVETIELARNRLSISSESVAAEV